MTREEYEKLKTRSNSRVTRNDYENLKKNQSTIANQRVQLAIEGGKEFGTVSVNAYRAVLNGTLDYYKPKDNEEKKVLDDYKRYVSSLQPKTVSETKEEAPKGRDANFWDVTINSIKRGYVQSLYGQESYKAMTGQKNNKAYYEEKLKSEDYSFVPNSWLEKTVSGAMELLGQQVRQWTDTRSLASGTALATTAAIAGQAGPQVALPEEVITIPSAFMVGLQVGSATANFEIDT